MTYENTPYELMRKTYMRRLVAAAVCTGVAAACTGLLYAGLAGGRWLAVIMLGCICGAAAFMLGLDVSQRWGHIRRTGFVSDAPKPYGYAGPAQSPVADLKRKPRSKPDLH